MILLLDIGNSRLKWARIKGARLQRGVPTLHDGKPERLIQKLPTAGITAVVVAQVMGLTAEKRLNAAIRRRFGIPATFAHVRRDFLGLRVAYKQPARLGVDRWLSMLGLRATRGGPFCVASAGTALTFDAVTADGRHSGGLIAAGLHTTERAVLGATRFPVRKRAPVYRRGLGRDTESCVRQGALHACAGLLERASAHGSGPRFLSGGDARKLLPHLAGRWTLRDDLVLEGLKVYARHA